MIITLEISGINELKLAFGSPCFLLKWLHREHDTIKRTEKPAMATAA
jgi:hypothetical protein